MNPGFNSRRGELAHALLVANLEAAPYKCRARVEWANPNRTDRALEALTTLEREVALARVKRLNQEWRDASR